MLLCLNMENAAIKVTGHQEGSGLWGWHVEHRTPVSHHHEDMQQKHILSQTCRMFDQKKGQTSYVHQHELHRVRREFQHDSYTWHGKNIFKNESEVTVIFYLANVFLCVLLILVTAKTQLCIVISRLLKAWHDRIISCSPPQMRGRHVL